MRGRGLAGCLVALLAVACSGPILANPPLVPDVPATPTATPTRPPDPQPITFPDDDGPHDRLTEWWYLTGHLRAEDGRRFGFEAVVFRAERGSASLSWASHLALTDESGGRFLYGQRAVFGGAVDHSPRATDGSGTGFSFLVPAVDPVTGLPAADAPWQLSGSGGRLAVAGALSPTEAAHAGGAFGLDLEMTEDRPAVLHGEIGWIDLGAAGGSYYYSRTRLRTRGNLALDGRLLRVEGSAWFDHQWGDFISVGGGGWDWFAVNLEDGTDLTVSLVRAADGSNPLIYGTLVDADGTVTNLGREAFEVVADPARTWTSPTTRATYPAGWTLRVAAEQLEIHLRPTVPDQELDTRPTTGVVYWEGSQVVSATRAGVPLGGQAYVELTGYGPAAR